MAGHTKVKSYTAPVSDSHWYDGILKFFSNFGRPSALGRSVGEDLGYLVNQSNGTPSSAVSTVSPDTGSIEVNSADPTSSASNVINYDPNKSAMENMLGYAQANNSASAYNTYLQNMYNTEMSNTALSRAIADAEANGISKYQLFQSGNMAASTPSSGSSMYQSYENAMNRRLSWNEKELEAITRIVASTISSAFSLLKK